jgi:hypothetical protein
VVQGQAVDCVLYVVVAGLGDSSTVQLLAGSWRRSRVQSVSRLSRSRSKGQVAIGGGVTCDTKP